MIGHDVGVPAPRPVHDSGPPPVDPVVRFEGVRKSFSGAVVLDGFDLSVERAACTVVLGPSGSGKSVALKHIVGLIRPDDGAVLFEGRRIDTMSERGLRRVRREIGFLFQLGALFDSMTVQENLEFPLREHTRAGARERAERVAEALDMVDMGGSQAKRPAELSGGQQKRVALARAIMLRPQLMLYDEPTTGLDPGRADGINDLIIKLQHELDVTSIVVTHDLHSAERVADRVVLLVHGRIIADGVLDEIRRSPDERARTFLAGRYGEEDLPPTP